MTMLPLLCCLSDVLAHFSLACHLFVRVTRAVTSARSVKTFLSPPPPRADSATGYGAATGTPVRWEQVAPRDAD